MDLPLEQRQELLLELLLLMLLLLLMYAFTSIVGRQGPGAGDRV